MTVKATINLQLTIEETFGSGSLPFGNTGNKTLTSGGLNKSQKYDANSTPDATISAYDSLPLVAGVASINLAAVANAEGAVNLTGKKVRAIIIQSDPTNTHDITISKGASNGFTGFGSAFSLTLAPGMQAVVQCGTVAVASGVRTLDVVGTGTEILNYSLIAGDV